MIHPKTKIDVVSRRILRNSEVRQSPCRHMDRYLGSHRLNCPEQDQSRYRHTYFPNHYSSRHRRCRAAEYSASKPTTTFQAHCSCRYYTKASGRRPYFLDNPIIGFEVRICLIHRRVFRFLHLQVLRQSSSSAAVTSRHSPGWSDSSSLRPPTATRLSESTTKCAAEHI